jgi:hypothetical protein
MGAVCTLEALPLPNSILLPSLRFLPSFLLQTAGWRMIRGVHGSVTIIPRGKDTFPVEFALMVAWMPPGLIVVIFSEHIYIKCVLMLFYFLYPYLSLTVGPNASVKSFTHYCKEIFGFHANRSILFQADLIQKLFRRVMK